MPSRPLPTGSPAPARDGRELFARAADLRRRADATELARRRHMILLAKWLLPVAAVVLLCTLAVWPEIEQIETGVRTVATQLSGKVTAARVTDAQYHSVDNYGRPYTLTAAIAQQNGPERVNLTAPKGDITLQNGTWLMVKAKQGVFIQHSNLLDLSHDVTLYRDDGTTLLTQSASLDLARGAGGGRRAGACRGTVRHARRAGRVHRDRQGDLDRVCRSGETGAERRDAGRREMNRPAGRAGLPPALPLVLPLLWALAGALVWTLAWALAGGIGTAAAQPLDLTHGGPITVTARDGIEWHQAQQEVIALGDARAVRGDVTVTADRLIAYYRKKLAPGAATTGAPGGTPGGAPATGAAAAQPVAAQPVAAQPAAAQSGLAADTDTAGTEIYRLRAEGNVQIFTQTDQA